MIKAVLLPALLLALLAGCRTVPRQPIAFNFPNVNPAHTHTRLLLENAMLYTGAANVMTDPASGYPFEGWNQEPKKGLYLRQFTQLTAIGEWLELMANITGRLRGQSVSVPHRSAGAAGANHRQLAARPAGPATRRPGFAREFHRL